MSTLEGMTRDAKRILVAQGVRAFAYGFGSVLLGVTLEQRGWSSLRVGLLLTAVLAGTVITTVAVGRYGDRIGRRMTYAVLFLGLSVAGLAFGMSEEFWLLALVALTGTLSTEVVESGPFTSLEQAMLPAGLHSQARTTVFGRYNAVATLAGSIGALAAGGPSLLRDAWSGAPDDRAFFLLFVPVGIAGALIARSLSEGVEAPPPPPGTPGRSGRLGPSRPAVVRLAALFAVDSFGGGFVVQAFMAYWFSVKFGTSVEVLGVVFFAVGILQSLSFLAATRLSARFGLLNTMVFTHLPSNLFLMAVPLAPTFPVALALLLARFALSQMDVPTRQAYLVALVTPEERTAAVATTNVARYVSRPLGPLLAGAAQRVALGLPFLIGGGVKVVYDLALYAWFRRIPLPVEMEER
jgi:MFS family permease